MGKSQNQHLDDTNQLPLNQNNQMSEDPGDGNRTSFTVGKDGKTPVEKKPPHDRQDQERIAELGADGAGSKD